MTGRASKVIETRGLTKQYGSVTAVDNLNLEVYEGEIFGLLGPNGAGKTTTILMLLGLTEPSAGSARVCGYDPVRQPLEVKKIVGYLPDRVSFYDNMTAVDNLLYTAALNSIPRKEAEERARLLLERVGLINSANRRVREFSRGMIQRLGLADVLIKNPRVIILDEPTLGIDPAGVQEILEFVTDLSRRERLTVLLSSHLLYQVQRICDRVAIFFRGSAVATGRIEELYTKIMKGGPYLIEVESPGTNLEQLLGRVAGVQRVRKDGTLTLVECEADIRQEISAAISQAGGVITHLRLSGYGLDEIYRRYFQEQEYGGGRR